MQPPAGRHKRPYRRCQPLGGGLRGSLGRPCRRAVGWTAEAGQSTLDARHTLRKGVEVVAMYLRQLGAGRRQGLAQRRRCVTPGHDSAGLPLASARPAGQSSPCPTLTIPVVDPLTVHGAMPAAAVPSRSRCSECEQPMTGLLVSVRVRRGGQERELGGCMRRRRETVNSRSAETTIEGLEGVYQPSRREQTGDEWLGARTPAAAAKAAILSGSPVKRQAVASGMTTSATIKHVADDLDGHRDHGGHP